ncbi:unnamed protein product, partial [marine sediment metagenome]
AGDKLCEVVFDQVRVAGENILGQLDQGWSVVQRVIEQAAVAKCCGMLGGMQRVLEMTVDYAKERKQFDRPIGSFQVIQHYCANMATDVDGSRFSTYQGFLGYSHTVVEDLAPGLATSNIYRRRDSNPR